MKKTTYVLVCMMLMAILVPTINATIGKVNGNEEKPDLIIEDIIKEELGHTIPPVYGLYCRVRNIDNSVVAGPIVLNVRVNLLLFGCVPLFFGRSFYGESPIGEVLPANGFIDIRFYSGRVFPSLLGHWIIGVYLVSAKVDPDNTIDESDDTNNYYSEIIWSW